MPNLHSSASLYSLVEQKQRRLAIASEFGLSFTMKSVTWSPCCYDVTKAALRSLKSADLRQTQKKKRSQILDNWRPEEWRGNHQRRELGSHVLGVEDCGITQGGGEEGGGGGEGGSLLEQRFCIILAQRKFWIWSIQTLRQLVSYRTICTVCLFQKRFSNISTQIRPRRLCGIWLVDQW